MNKEFPSIAAGSYRKVLVIGPLPPPRNGVTAVNAYVIAALKKRGATVEYCDTSSGAVRRTLGLRLSRLPRVLTALRTVAFGQLRSRMACYLSMSGGWGILYEISFIILARIRRARLFVHHHSFQYIDRYSFLMQAVAWFGGRSMIHVVLCGRMGEILRRRYGVQELRVVSNAAFLELRPGDRAKGEVSAMRTVGFLSNISFEKGVEDVLTLARNLPHIRFCIAGPFQDSAVERHFNSAAAALPNIKYYGPVLGDAKKEFFAELNAFVFPTRYRNEAEPLVVLEALMNGCPVVANNRGCIRGMLPGDVGVVVEEPDRFVDEASSALLEWATDDALYARLAQAARLHFTEVSRQACEARESLFDEMLMITQNAAK